MSRTAGGRSSLEWSLATAEAARGLLVPEATMAKRLTRESEPQLEHLRRRVAELPR